jgi:hypothetical protein
MPKIYDLSKKNFFVCHAPLKNEICATPTASPLKARILGQFDAPHTRNFDKIFFSKIYTKFWFSTHFYACKLLHASMQQIACKLYKVPHKRF